MSEKRFELKWRDTGEVLYDNETGLEQRIYSPDYRFHVRDMMNELNDENKNLSKLNKILEGFLLDKGYDFKDIIKFVQEKTDEKGDVE